MTWTWGGLPLGAVEANEGAAGLTVAVVAILLSYLLGSVPFGLVLGRLRGVDIRTVGSGNIGATNVGRALGRPWALVAFALDFLKGYVPAWLAPGFATQAGSVGPSTLAVLCAGAAVCGHVWPLYLGFKGGKGVATACGGMVAIDPVVFLGGGAVWLVTLALSRFVGLASIAMGMSFPVIAWLRRDAAGYGLEVVWGALALTFLVLVRHRANIARMRAGTEPRIGGSKPEDPVAEDGRASTPRGPEGPEGREANRENESSS